MNNLVKKHVQHSGQGVHDTDTDYRRQSKHPREFLDEILLEDKRYEEFDRLLVQRSQN